MKWVNTIHNLISYETIFCNDRDSSWINTETKKKIMVEKNKTYKSYCCFNKNMFLFEKFKFVQSILMKDSTSKGATLNC